MPILASVLNRRRWPVLAILVLALALRLWDIRARALWFDEASEYWVATAPVAQLVESARTGSGDPPLYAFLLHTWMQLGSGEVWLRLLSTLASVSGVLAVMILGSMLAGPVAAICAGLLLALLPVDIRYAQEVGQYGFVPAIVAWNLVCLVNLTRHGTWRWIFGWVLTALAGSYLYYGTVFPIAGAFLCAIAESIFRRDLRARRATGTALVLYIAALVPLLVTYLPTQLSRVIASGGTARAPEAHSIAQILNHKWQMACDLIAFQFAGWPHSHIPAVAIVAPVMLLIVVAIWKSWRVVVWFAVAVNLYAAADALGFFPMGYRWGLILTPLIICAVAAGLAAIATRARWAMFAVLIALLGVCVVSLPNRTLRDRFYKDTTGTWPETEDMRVVANYWMEHRAADQPTYVYYGAAPAFGYYTREFAPREGLPSTWHFACWHERDAPMYCRKDGICYGRWIRSFDTRGKVANVFETIGRPAAFWIVFGHMMSGDDRDMINHFKFEHYRVDASVEAVNASAVLLVYER